MSGEDVILGRMARNDAKIEERGPGLYWDLEVWVLARCTVHGVILVGGLGSFGAGRMWGHRRDGDAIEDDETYLSSPDRCGEDRDDFGVACDGSHDDGASFILAVTNEHHRMQRLRDSGALARAWLDPKENP